MAKFCKGSVCVRQERCREKARRERRGQKKKLTEEVKQLLYCATALEA